MRKWSCFIFQRIQVTWTMTKSLVFSKRINRTPMLSWPQININGVASVWMHWCLGPKSSYFLIVCSCFKPFKSRYKTGVWYCLQMDYSTISSAFYFILILENTESCKNNRRKEKGKGREREEKAIPSLGEDILKILKSTIKITDVLEWIPS